MVSKRHVSYLRVSTPKQGENGLGVEAQREAVRRYLLSHHGEQIAEFVEVESGKRSDRPQLATAMALAKKRKATLLVAKLDRLSRSVAFIATLMDSKGFDLAIADMPGANRLTLHVLAAAAEHERHMIGERTRHALAAAKARGIKLGNPEQAKINRARRPRGLRRCARTLSAASRLAAHRAMPSQPISTRAASRHRMAANGFRCRFVASAIVSAYDRRGVVLPGVKVFPPGREHHAAHGLRNFHCCGAGISKSKFRWRPSNPVRDN